MLFALETAMSDLLKGAFPALFTGTGAASLSFPADTWDFDPLSADPVAGEPGPEDAVDRLAFDPAEPAGPYTLTRPPYPGPKRVYLRSADGELLPLSNAELNWDAMNPGSFRFAPRAGRETAGFDELEVHYGVIAAATKLKTRHRLTLQIIAADAAKAEQALTLSLAALVLNRNALKAQGGHRWNTGDYQAEATVKSLKFVSGAGVAASNYSLIMDAEIELRLERLLGDDEGRPITRIVSPGRAGSNDRKIDIDPAVQA